MIFNIANIIHKDASRVIFTNFSTPIQFRVVHGSDGPVGWGGVGSGHDFAGFWRVGSGRVSTSDVLVLA